MPSNLGSQIQRKAGVHAEYKLRLVDQLNGNHKEKTCNNFPLHILYIIICHLYNYYINGMLNTVGSFCFGTSRNAGCSQFS